VVLQVILFPTIIFCWPFLRTTSIAVFPKVLHTHWKQQYWCFEVESTKFRYAYAPCFWSGWWAHWTCSEITSRSAGGILHTCTTFIFMTMVLLL
jgi:hypothetical protein